MENNKKKNLITTGIYIIASFCFFALLAMGVFSSLRTVFNKKPDDIGNQEIKTVIDNNNVNKLPEVSDLPSIPENNDVFEPELVPENTSENTENVPEIIEKTKYVLPVSGEITKDFSSETLVFSQTMNDYRVHKGIDFQCEKGQVVTSFADGTIESFDEDPLNGFTMTLRHSENLITRYCNLSHEMPEGLEVGSKVIAGENIGFIGEPGILECGEGYHLHFEIEKNGQKVGLNEFELS